MPPPVSRESVFIARPSNIQGARGFAAAFQFLTDGADHLRVRSWSSVAGVTVAIQGRQVKEDGTIVPFGYVHLPNSDRTRAESFEQLAAGAILNLGVFVSSGTVKRGECFVELALVRGITANAYYLGTIVQGYVGSVNALSWPGSPIEGPTEGNGVIKDVGGAVAGGAEVVATVPSNTLWRVHEVSASLNSGPAAATRQPALVFDDGAAIYMRSAQRQTQIAAETKTYLWAPGMPLETVLFDGIGVAGLPTPSFLQAGHRIRTVTAGIGGTELWEFAKVMVEEWLRP